MSATGIPQTRIRDSGREARVDRGDTQIVKLNIGGHCVGAGETPYFIVDIGSNHNGDMDLCRRLIDTAKTCGVDAVKFQSWSKESLISRAEYARNTSYTDPKRHFGTLEEMVERYQLTPLQHLEMLHYSHAQGITFLSSAFSEAEVDLLDALDVAAFKVASMDINNLPLLDYISKKKRPIILSTGMSTLGEIETALKALRGCPVALLHCVSLYPPDDRQINLRNIMTLQQAFDVPVGFSDHTVGTSVPLAAIACGACIIEKHFTLDKNMDGWDHAISADPLEIETLVREGKRVFAALGSSVRTVSQSEMEKRKKFRRRLVVKRSMKKGEPLFAEDVTFKRPGNGIHPDELAYVMGRTLTRDVAADDEIDWSDLGAWLGSNTGSNQHLMRMA